LEKWKWFISLEMVIFTKYLFSHLKILWIYRLKSFEKTILSSACDVCKQRQSRHGLSVRRDIFHGINGVGECGSGWRRIYIFRILCVQIGWLLIMYIYSNENHKKIFNNGIILDYLFIEWKFVIQNSNKSFPWILEEKFWSVYTSC